jgi:dTDP-4-amino-4,6-dideoxygalactose transaminase
MMQLFNIQNYTIDTSLFKNILHDEIITEFEREFALYVGAKYACFANSASSLLFLSLLGKNVKVRLPSTIPPVVPNVIINTGNTIEFYDNTRWVGHQYHLHGDIYDSAQEVTRNQYKELNNPNALVIFSFYPTKPVGSCDGGMIVSDNKETIEWYRVMTLNGMSYSDNNWERKQSCAGYKLHGNSIQAYIAYQNLKRLDSKYKALDDLCHFYNDSLIYNNTSRHLYRIVVKNNVEFINNMRDNGIVCGIHYAHCHDKPFYGNVKSLPESELESRTTVSIPYHEELSLEDRKKVVYNVLRFENN